MIELLVKTTYRYALKFRQGSADYTQQFSQKNGGNTFTTTKGGPRDHSTT